jgi:hypothetical protein
MRRGGRSVSAPGGGGFRRRDGGWNEGAGILVRIGGGGGGGNGLPEKVYFLYVCLFPSSSIVVEETSFSSSLTLAFLFPFVLWFGRRRTRSFD